MIYFLIPARAGSKGWPGKNRELFKYTADTLLCCSKSVIVSTDDDIVSCLAAQYGFDVIARPPEIAGDSADIVSVMKHAAEEKNMTECDIIILLYLVHPDRTTRDIDKALSIFSNSNSQSLVCRFPAKSNPYKCISESGIPIRGNGMIYRRQDFPVCYEVIHFVAIYKVSELYKLNYLAYNENTTWLDIKEPVDIDTQEDFEKFIKGEK